MKKQVSFGILVILFFSLMTAVFAATEYKGATFDGNTVCFVRDNLASHPITVEATIYLNKRTVGTKEGVYFGNFHSDASWDSPTSSIAYSITEKGNPMVRYKDDTGQDAYTFTFTDANIIRSEWVHLTITFDNAAKEVRCYVDGELCGTEKLKEDFSVWTNQYGVGGDMNILNPYYFKGTIKSLAVYSDVRTEKEIKADMKTQGKDGLILHYDFSDVSDELPVVIKDKSSSKNDAQLGRIWVDEKDPITDYAYSFAVIGDTQNMAKHYTSHFNEIYNWVYDNIDKKNIEMVIGLGDITDTTEGGTIENEWKAAAEGFDIIDGYVPHIPIRGNHDNIYWYNKTVSQIDYADMVDGQYENDLRNAYVEMDIGGIPYLFLQLDFYMDQDILNWACDVVEQHPDRNVIISRHGYLWRNGAPIENGTDANACIEGEEMWDKLVSQYKNIVLVLSGHISSDRALATQRKGVNGNIVTEMLLDFQSIDNKVCINGYSENGAGVVCMFYFSEDGRKMTVEAYSTVTKQYFYDANCYTIELDIVSDTEYVKPDKAPTPPRELPKTQIKMTINSKTAYVNGEAKTLDAAPIIKNSRTLLPVRFLAENLGASVEWNDATKTATLKTSDTTIEVTINAKAMKVNGEAVALDSPAIIENSRTYLPLRAIANALGVSNDNITWDDSTKTATFVK